MIELNTIHHTTNLAHITITRIGEARTTRYQISAQSEAKQESEAAQVALPIVSKYTKGEYGQFVKH